MSHSSQLMSTLTRVGFSWGSFLGVVNTNPAPQRVLLPHGLQGVEIFN